MEGGGVRGWGTCHGGGVLGGVLVVGRERLMVLMIMEELMMI